MKRLAFLSLLMISAPAAALNWSGGGGSGGGGNTFSNIIVSTNPGGSGYDFYTNTTQQHGYSDLLRVYQPFGGQGSATEPRLRLRVYNHVPGAGWSEPVWWSYWDNAWHPLWGSSADGVPNLSVIGRGSRFGFFDNWSEALGFNNLLGSISHDSTVLTIDPKGGTSDGTEYVSINGPIKIESKTKAQLRAMSGQPVGVFYRVSDSTVGAVYESTGTGQGQFANIADRSLGLDDSFAGGGGGGGDVMDQIRIKIAGSTVFTRTFWKQVPLSVTEFSQGNFTVTTSSVVCATAGRYIVVASVGLSVGDTATDLTSTTIAIRLYKNSAIQAYERRGPATGTTSAPYPKSVKVTDIVELQPGDTLAIHGYHNYSSSPDYESASEVGTFLAVARLPDSAP